VIRFLLLIGCLFVFSCKTQDQKPQEYTTLAILTNNMALNGCDWLLSFLKEDNAISSFSPSDNSLSKVIAFADANPSPSSTNSYFPGYSFEVKLRFRYTGSQKEVPCGKGSNSTFKEIEVISLTKP
jgi:hypothetical protein